MFENLKAGWALGKQVRKLVFSDRQLILYPLLSSVVVFVEFFLIFASLFINSVVTGGSVSGILYIVALFLFYLVSTFTATYILMALLIAFRSYANGHKIGMVEAFRQTSQYTTLILEWAVFYSVVLLIVRLIEQRMGAMGRLIFGLAAGVAIGVATIFAIPVILDNKVGPVQAVKQGAEFFVRNIGKAAGGLIYSDLYNLMFIIAGVGLLFLGIVAMVVSVILGGAMAIFGLILIVFGGIMNFLTSNVFKLILFEYVNGKPLPKGISKELIDRSLLKNKQTSA